MTVVIPTRNRASRVATAVASAQRQTLKDIEIIVVDDGSTDNTVGVLAKIAAEDARVRVLRQPSSCGAPVARNRGLDARRGEFVGFLDDDDQWLPSKLEQQVAFLRARPQVALVGCHHRIRDEQTGQTTNFNGPADFVGDDLLWSNILGTASNALVAPDRLPGDVRFDPEFPAYQDWDFYLQCNRHAGVAVAPRVLCEYVVHEEQERLTNQLSKRLAGHRLLLARHGAEMTPACLAYHQARMRILATTSRRDKLRLAPVLLRESPRIVLRALLAESVHGRIGGVTGDPARAMRHLQRVAIASRRASGDSRPT